MSILRILDAAVAQKRQNQRLRYRQQTEFAAPVGSTTQGMGPVTDAVYARVRGWLDALVRSLDPQTLGSLLYFMTGRKTVRASDFLDEEKDTITVLIWGPDRANIKEASRAGAGNVATVDGWLPTSSTCARQLQLPAYTSALKLREQLLGALKQMEEGERQGRCEFGYE